MIEEIVNGVPEAWRTKLENRKRIESLALALLEARTAA